MVLVVCLPGDEVCVLVFRTAAICIGKSSGDVPLSDSGGHGAVLRAVTPGDLWCFVFVSHVAAWEGEL